MNVDDASVHADSLRSIDDVTLTEVCTHSDSGDVFIEFEVTNDTESTIARDGLSYEVLRFLSNNDLRLVHNTETGVWEAWPREMDDSDAVVYALLRLGDVHEEASAKHRTVNDDTVADAITAFRNLADRGVDFEDPTIDDTIENLEEISRVVESQTRRVDHRPVRELLDEVERAGFDHGYL